MNRLSEGAIELNDVEVFNNCSYSCYSNLADALNKLAEYENVGLQPEHIDSIIEQLLGYLDAEQAGLLIELPCKVGDKVYEIYTKYDEKEDNYVRGIEELLLMRFGKNQYFEYAILKREDGEDSVTLEQFGKTVFLTREEAEKALEEQ